MLYVVSMVLWVRLGVSSSLDNCYCAVDLTVEESCVIVLTYTILDFLNYSSPYSLKSVSSAN